MVNKIMNLINEYEKEVKRLESKKFTIPELELQANGKVNQLKATIRDLNKLLSE